MNSNLKALSGYCILILVVFKSFVHIAWLMHNLVQQSIILLITQVQLDITKGGQYCQLISNIYNIYIYLHGQWSALHTVSPRVRGLTEQTCDIHGLCPPFHTWVYLSSLRGRGQVSECRKSTHDRCVMATENIDDYRWQHRLSAIKYTVHAGNLLY